MKKRNCSICNVPKWRSGNRQVKKKLCKIKNITTFTFSLSLALAHSGSANKGKISYLQLKKKKLFLKERKNDGKEKRIYTTNDIVKSSKSATQTRQGIVKLDEVLFETCKLILLWNYSIVRRDTNVSGVSPRRPVTHEELSQHNTR